MVGGFSACACYATPCHGMVWHAIPGCVASLCLCAAAQRVALSALTSVDDGLQAVVTSLFRLYMSVLCIRDTSLLRCKGVAAAMPANVVLLSGLG